MKKYVKKVSKKNKKPAGSIVHIGDKKRENVKITVFKYNAAYISKANLSSKEFRALKLDTNYNYWIVIDGLHDPEVMELVKNTFNINKIVIENIVNTSIRPSIDVYKDYAFVVTKEIGFNALKEIEFEQISLLVSNKYLITFTENKLDAFEVISKMLDEENFREKGISYLCYTILDFIVDNYFVFMESIDDQLELIEDMIFSNMDNIDLEKVYKLKKDLLLIQKSIWPQREIINIILRERGSVFNDDYDEFYRDVSDHIYQVKDMIDVFRDIISGVLDIYLTSKSNKMNEIMKFLTMISTTFIPITFVAGLYGMNFSNMPELHMKYGYFGALIVMAIVFFSMLAYFRSKKWF